MHEMSKALDAAKKRIEELESTHGVTNNNINIYVQNNNTYNINKYGEEKVDYITDDMLEDAIKDPIEGSGKIIGYTHCHKDHPENHTVRIISKKNPFIKVFNGEGWDLRMTEKVLSELIERPFGLLNDYQFLAKDKQAATRYDDFYNKFSDDDPELRKQLMTHAMLALLNGKHIQKEAEQRRASPPEAGIKDVDD
jgi:hypothetical protein